MVDVKNTLEELQERLTEKKSLLDILQSTLNEQDKTLKNESLEINELDLLLKEKERLYMKLEKVDSRINLLLVDISKEKSLRTRYPILSTDIEDRMNRIQELGISIEKKENNSKDLFKDVFQKHRESVKSYRQTRGVINQYSKNMGTNNGDDPSYFMDKKK